MEQLLATKFNIPPARQRLVPRPRLLRKLNEGLHCKLTLISAPAGFGKTTLVNEWISEIMSTSKGETQSPFRVAWLSLDEDDNNLARFLTYFITALKRVDGLKSATGEQTLDMLRSPHPMPAETILISLVNEISVISDRIVFVLDDYHLIEEQPIHEALTYLLEHSPRQLHIVIATREDPLIPLARLRARCQLTELRAADLRFSPSETIEFLNQVMELDLSTEDIVALEDRTEGWIAGLQLAAVSLQGQPDKTNLIRSFTGSHRFVLDYLLEDVLSRQPGSFQDFLVQTSILKQLTGPLCDAITDQDNGQVTLDRLDRSNLFVVPLDHERHWYRYHHLFGELLNLRLQQTHSKQISILHQRASAWYERNGFIDEAIEHALQGEAFERAADLIEGQFGVKYGRGDHALLRRWMAKLPQELVFVKPQLCIIYAWNMFTSGQLEEAGRSLQAAERLLNPGRDRNSIVSFMYDQLAETDRRTLLGKASAIQAFLASYRGDAPGTIQHARKALENLPTRESPWRGAASIALGDAFMAQGDMQAAYKARSESLLDAKATGDTYLLMIASLRLAETLRQKGSLQQITNICEQQMRNAKQSRLSKSVVAGSLLAIWGEVLAEFNELDSAERKVKQGVDLTERGSDVAMIGWSNLWMLRVLFSKGDLNGMQEVLRKMEDITRNYDLPIGIPLQLSAWQAHLWLKQDKLEMASRWAEDRGLDVKGNPSYLHEMESIALTRILTAQERFEEAAGLLQRLLEAAKAGERTARMIEILIIQALGLQKQANTSQAITVLETALSLAEPGGFVRTFVDEGLSMAQLLYETLSRGIASDYVQRLLAAFPAPEQAAQPDAKTSKFELIEPLSEREIQVLQLMAEGLTNPEIAERLYVSLNTVKVHSRNIYGKLGVNNRTQAGARARALGILPLT